MKSADNMLIRLIALFKLLKATLLIAVGMSALHLLHKDVAGIAEHWVTVLGLDPGNRYVGRALQKVADLTPQKIKSLGVVSFIYAGLFLTEGTRSLDDETLGRMVQRNHHYFADPNRDLRDLPPSKCDQVFGTHGKYRSGVISSPPNSQRTR